MAVFSAIIIGKGDSLAVGYRPPVPHMRNTFGLERFAKGLESILHSVPLLYCPAKISPQAAVAGRLQIALYRAASAAWCVFAPAIFVAVIFATVTEFKNMADVIISYRGQGSAPGPPVVIDQCAGFDRRASGRAPAGIACAHSLNAHNLPLMLLSADL